MLKVKTAIKSAGEQGVTLENVSTTAESPFPETGDLGRIKFALLPASTDNDIEILSYADYYPFGLKIPERNATSAYGYRFGYQGQFAEDETGETGYNSFELRLWDPTIGRWTTTDPYGQYFSPYLGMGNNPIVFTDPDGGYSKIGSWIRMIFNGGYNHHYNEAMDEWGYYTSEMNEGSFDLDFIANYGVANSEGGSWVSDAWDWTKDHFYIGAEGEITYGVQLAGKINKAVGLNLNIASQTVLEGKISNKGSYANSYPIVPLAHMDKGKALDFGVGWIVGGNYNWNIENGKHTSSQLGLGIYGFGGNIIWNDSGVTNLFLGFELGGKVAAGWGAGGSGKIGFNWDW
jgi:RHS repeat-associated protein